MIGQVLTLESSQLIHDKSNQLRVMSLIAKSGYAGELPNEDLEFLFGLYHDVSVDIMALCGLAKPQEGADV